MTHATRSLSKDRLLVLVPLEGIGAALAEHTGRPVVTLLATNGAIDSPDLDVAISSLLDVGCEFFVCFGAVSEALHDKIDEAIIGRARSDISAATTWHDDETAGEVTGFFLNVAGSRRGALLIAVVGSNDAELVNSLNVWAAQNVPPESD